jgi:hypothetical protein
VRGGGAGAEAGEEGEEAAAAEAGEARVVAGEEAEEGEVFPDERRGAGAGSVQLNVCVVFFGGG